MCEESKLQHRTKDETHIYVCPLCSFVGFEYIDEKSIEYIEELLN